jgi:hypothetical protein
MLTLDQINAEWLQFEFYIKHYIKEPRSNKLWALYLQYMDRIKTLPAASNPKHHSAFPGGHIHHTNNVIKNALALHDVWVNSGVNVNYTVEELVFAAVNHDLGKMGDHEQINYIDNPSQWHKENLGSLYDYNPSLEFMSVPDRGLFMLQLYNIPVSRNEYIAIKIHDGLYADANKIYLFNNKPHSAISYILHQADSMAARIEHEQQYLFAPKPEKKETIQQRKQTKPKAFELVNSSDKSSGLVNAFDNL